jgi:hypothetical protein
MIQARRSKYKLEQVGSWRKSGAQGKQSNFTKQLVKPYGGYNISCL